MRALFLQNYTHEQNPNISGSPKPFFIFLTSDSTSDNMDNSAFIIPIPRSRPPIVDLGFKRFSIVQSLIVRSFFRKESERDTYTFAYKGVTRTFKEYSYNELREIFSIMIYEPNVPGRDWELVSLELANSIFDNTIQTEPRVFRQSVASANLAQRNDPPQTFFETTVNFISRGLTDLDYDPVNP